MPFSDPMADGPAIQAAGLRALKAGMTLRRTLDLVRDFRKADDATPIVLMGYYNPIYRYGVPRFVADAKAAGVDGLIVVDLPPEEDDELCVPALDGGLDFIRLATPTTDDARLPAVLAHAERLRLLRLDRRHHRHEIGGCRRPSPPPSRGCAATPTCRSRSASASERRTQAAEVARVADAAVVGTALVQRLAENLDADGTGEAGPRRGRPRRRRRACRRHPGARRGARTAS